LTEVEKIIWVRSEIKNISRKNISRKDILSFNILSKSVTKAVSYNSMILFFF